MTSLIVINANICCSRNPRHCKSAKHFLKGTKVKPNKHIYLNMVYNYLFMYILEHH